MQSQQVMQSGILRDYTITNVNKNTLSGGPSGRVSLLLALPNGNLVSVIDESHKLKYHLMLWDSKTGQLLKILDSDNITHRVEAMTYFTSENGRLCLASGSIESGWSSSHGIIKLWDMQTFKNFKTINKAHSDKNGNVDIKALVTLPDGRLVSGAQDKKIKLWNRQTYTCQQTLEGHEDSVRSLLVLPDDRLISAGGDIKIWNIKTGQCLKTIDSKFTNELALLPEGRFASNASDEKLQRSIIKLWDSTTGQCLQTLKDDVDDGHCSAPFAVLSGGVLASAFWYYSGTVKAIRLWDIKTFKCLIDLQEQAYVNDLTVLPDGRLASCNDQGKITLWDFPQLTLQPSSVPTAKPVTAVISTPKPVPKSPVINSVPAAAIFQAPSSINTKPLLDDHGKINVSLAITYSDLQLGKELGRGAYGVVYQAEHNYTPVAVKKLLNQDLKASLVEEFKQESSIMAGLRSPFIVQLYGVCLEKPHYSIVMEYMPKGSLFNLLQSEEKVSWTIRYQIGLDVGCGLAYLHKQNVIHADLKSLNVLLDNQYKAKLSDFGLAKIKLTSSASTVIGASSGGSIRWMAPEFFEEENVKSTKASDVFSYGTVLWELGSRQIPFVNSRNEAVPILVMKGKRETITSDTPPSMAKLIARCWEGRADQRPRMDEAVKILRDNQKEVSAITSSNSTNSGYRPNTSSV